MKIGFPKPVRVKKTSRKALVRKLDSLVSKYVIARDKKCVNCGKRENLTGGHLFSRAAYSTRWDVNNVFCQCIGCNMRHEYDPYPLTSYFIEKYNMVEYDALHYKYSHPKKFKDYELQEMIKLFEGAL